MKKQLLPKIGDICYITFKVSETETTEELGYLEISQVEDEVENGFVDKEGNYFEYFFHIPAIDKYFEISQLVSWRDINGWISVDETLPEFQGYYLVFCPYWENKVCSVEFDLDLGDFLDFSDEITHWQPLPPLPKDNL